MYGAKWNDDVSEYLLWRNNFELNVKADHSKKAVNNFKERDTTHPPKYPRSSKDCERHLVSAVMFTIEH